MDSNPGTDAWRRVSDLLRDHQLKAIRALPI